MQNHAPTATSSADDTSGDFDIVALWLKKDPIRWVSGVIAGALAAVVALIVAGIFSAKWGSGDAFFPAKLMGSILAGAEATDNLKMSGAIIGGIFTMALGSFWGVFYAHFVRTTNLVALLAMGWTWGVFLWIFNWNLFFQSFSTIVAAQVSRGAVFFVCLAYGFSLASVKVIDSVLRGGKPL